MNRFTCLIAIIFSFLFFSFYIVSSQLRHEVLEVISPVQIAVDLNNNKKIDNDEIICVAEVESFSLNPTKEFVENYTKSLNITENDILNMGYLAQDYSLKLLKNKNVKVSFTGESTPNCKYANVTLNKSDYSKILANSGYGLGKTQVLNYNAYKEKLDVARKLHLVVYNHKSEKYHKLECEYGKLAHDKVLIPENQLPEGAKPCKYCHKINKLLKKKKFTADSEHNVSYKHANFSDSVDTQGNLTLYYSNFTNHLIPNKKCLSNECKAVVNLINQSNSSIDIAIYGYEDIPAITQALISAKNRGVKIRFVYDVNSPDGKSYYNGNSVIKNIACAHTGDFGKYVSYIMHNKFIVFDESVVLTGSMNFSSTGLSAYDLNDVLVINSSDVAKLYLKEFEQLIQGKFHNSKVSVTFHNRFNLDNSEIEVYFSPKDTTSERIIQIIDNANKYIYIPAYLITHNLIHKALIRAYNRGVDVKIILDANSVNTNHTKHNELRKAGISVKFENYAGKLHSKTMIIDDEYIIMGSMNFSNSGENKNDENTLIIKNITLAKNYKNFFLGLWSVIPDKYLKSNPKSEGVDSIGSCSDGIDNNFNGLIDSQDPNCNIKK